MASKTFLFWLNQSVAYAGTKAEVKVRRRNFYVSNRARLLASKRMDYEPGSRRDYNRKYYLRNQLRFQQARHRYYLANGEKVRADSKSWRHANREQLNAHRRKRRRTDPRFRLESDLRRRINKALRNVRATRSAKLEKLIGCSVEFLMGYLEAQFKEGMSWTNRGLWHVDHIRPCAKFDLTKKEDQARCFHYSNLQPLWAADNLAKADFCELAAGV